RKRNTTSVDTPKTATRSLRKAICSIAFFRPRLAPYPISRERQAQKILIDTAAVATSADR
ncbi:MAG: hypothetical protein ACREJ8_05345, partial [Candidatus Methylomirabilales bacterium]